MGSRNRFFLGESLEVVCLQYIQVVFPLEWRTISRINKIPHINATAKMTAKMISGK